MRRAVATAVVVVLIAMGCTSETSVTGTEGLAREDAVDCRQLGGGWVYLRYERGGTAAQGVSIGLPTSDERLLAGSEFTEEGFETARELRIANGWDDDEVAQLSGPDVPPDLEARLAAMPSCLDQLLRGDP